MIQPVKQLTDAEAAEIQHQLAPEGLVGYEGQVLEFEARGAVAKLFQCRDDEVILSGPAGTGKSRGILEYVHLILSRFPGAKGLICRKTLISLTETGLVTYRNHVLHKMDGVYFYGGSKSEPASFRYPNGSTLLVGGLDSTAKVMSADYDIIFVQEATDISESDAEDLTTRLRNGKVPFQQIIMDCNPKEPWHWILRRSQRGDLTLFESRHQDNPTLYHPDGTMTERGEVYIRRLNRLTGVKKERMLYGKWVAAEGIVYDEFSEGIHVIPKFKIPPDWLRIRSIDFGFVNPFVCQWWAVSPDNIMYLYREIYRTQKLVSDHADYINFLTGKTHIAATVADHDAEDRATLQSKGIRSIAARKAIIPGIEEVQKRLRVGTDGKAGLYLFDGAVMNRETALSEDGKPTCTREEMNVYAWPPEAKRDKLAKELPIDLNNHGCDAMRYAVMYVAKRSKVTAPAGPSIQPSKWLGRFERESKYNRDSW